MSPLSVYRFLSKNLKVSYRSKILIAVLASAYIPVAAAIVYVVGFEAPPGVLLRTLGAAVVTAVVGTTLTLLLLIHLLEPIAIASRTLRRYAADGVLPELPADLDDEAGQLLADAHHTIRHMDYTLRQLTEYDQVTGLPNRKTFERELAPRMRTGAHFALCAMSLSNYDTIVSAFGQEAIDGTCRHVAKRFKETLELGTRITRTGAKTFLFELDLAEGEKFVATRVEEIRVHMQREPSLPGFNVYPKLNAGISIFRGQEIDAETLMNEAISAMADTDSRAEVRTHFFSPEQSLAARNAFTLERDLRLAVALNQLSLHYQPLVDLGSGRVVGAEALVRWTHPERGAVSPGLFIPIAEKTGLIDELGLWILGETCRQLDAWSVTHLNEIKISMNLSVRQFLRPQVVQLILEALNASAVQTRLLEVELTETAMIEDHEMTREVLEEFRSRGITTAIDDFGAGFSSLSYLKTMPFDRIKIDREFIRDVDQSNKSSAICRALIELAHGLEIEVLAEGTETSAEVEHMRGLGCTLFQGFYFSRPVAAEFFPDAVRKAEAIAELHSVPSLLAGAEKRAPAWVS